MNPGQATGPALDVLVPPSAPIDPDPDEVELRRRYAYPVPARGSAVVRANMVASIDGGAWGTDHRSGTINDAADGRVFDVLRALADVLLVGAGTVGAEGYRRIALEGRLARHRAAPLDVAVVTRSGLVPPVLTADDRPALVITGAQGATAARNAVGGERVIVVGPGSPDPAGATSPVVAGSAATPMARASLDLAEALAALADRGMVTVLCEGGPTLLGALMAADLLDELCLTTTGTLVGPGPGRIVDGPGQTGRTAAHAVRPAHLVHLLHAGGTTLARWAVPIG